MGQAPPRRAHRREHHPRRQGVVGPARTHRRSDRVGAAGLTIVRTRERVQLEGPETARRRLIGALFREEANRGMREVDRIESWFAAGDLTAFKTSLIARLVADGYEINDYGLGTVLLHLAIAVDRTQARHALPERAT